MQHNLYLHSALVQSRYVPRYRQSIAQATRFNLVDSIVALNGAFFVNAAILIVAAAAFGTRGIVVEGIQDAHRLLEGVLGTRAAPIAFALALIAAGQSSTVTGTLAGQITMEGFIQMRLRPWVRRLITRSLAIIPAVLVISYSGEQGTERLLVLSQVILSLQLPFAIVPLVKFTSSKRWMRDFVNKTWVAVCAWLAALVIISLNARLVWEQIGEWSSSYPDYRWPIRLSAGTVALALGALLAYLIVRREREHRVATVLEAEQIAKAAVTHAQSFRRIGVALEAQPTDSIALAEAIALAKAHNAELVLMHVVEGVGGQWYGEHAGDTEQRHDQVYLQTLADRLRQTVDGQLRGVRAVFGYGSNVPGQLLRLVRQENLDLVVTGGHGHHKITDIFTGETIASLRHGLKIPVLSVRSPVTAQ
jgi:manganese transport protein